MANQMRYFLSIIYGFVVTTMISCNSSEPAKTNSGQDQVSPDIVNNAATASGQENAKKLPVFSFEETSHFFGTINSGERMSYDFKFKNTGNADLIISQATGSCGCTIPEYSKDPIKPGDEGVIKVKYNSEGHGGMVSKTITLLANTIPNTKVLTISAEVLK